MPYFKIFYFYLWFKIYFFKPIVESIRSWLSLASRSLVAGDTDERGHPTQEEDKESRRIFCVGVVYVMFMYCQECCWVHGYATYRRMRETGRSPQVVVYVLLWTPAMSILTSPRSATTRKRDEEGEWEFDAISSKGNNLYHSKSL